MDRDKMSILYRGPSIDASYQVSVHLAERFQRRRLKCEKLSDDGKSSLWLKTSIFQLYRGSQFCWWRKPSTQRKPLTCRKSLTNFISGACTHNFSDNMHWLQNVVVNPIPIRSWPWLPLNEHLSFSKDWTLQVHDNSFNTLTNFDIMSSKWWLLNYIYYL